MNALYKDYGYASADSNGWAAGYLMAPLRQMIGKPRGAMLDLGCGNGAISRMLLRDGYDVYGLDASESGIALANQQAPGRFFVADLSSGELPVGLAGKRFECVISTEVIEHLYQPSRLLDFARSALTKDGEIIVSTPYHGYLKNLLLAVSGKLDVHFTALWEGGHIKFFSRATLETLLAQQGFTVTAFAGAGRYPYLWKSMLLKAKVARP